MHECREFHNCYNRRHNRIADKIADEIKQSCPRSRVYSNKMLETVFPEFHDQLVLFPHRKPDILVIDPVLKSCNVVEVTVLNFTSVMPSMANASDTSLFVTSFEKGIGTLRWWFCVLDPSDVLRKMFGVE